jgi:MFS family permease
MLAAAAASTPLAVLADRFPRRRVMAASDLLRAVLTVGMAATVAVGGPIGVVYALAVISSVAGAPFRPAEAAITPALAESPEQLTACNAVASTIESASFFVGPGIGGLVLALSGVQAVLVACTAAFAASAWLVARLGEPPGASDAAGAEPGGGVMAGLHALVGEPALLAVTLTYAAQALVAGALTVFNVVLAIDVLGLGNAGVGYLDGAYGVGGVLGGVAAVGLASSRRLAAAFAAGVLAWGVGVALLGLSTSVAVSLVLLGGVGLGNTVVDVAAVTLLQRSADDVVLGRVFGVLETVMLASLGLGSLLAPLLIHLIGVRAAVVITGLLLPGVLAVAARTLVGLDADPQVVQRVAALRRHRIFAPLSEATLEQLAGELAAIRCEPGTPVIRQGEAGDRVYLVASGTLEVTVDGAAGTPLGAGDVFGEIALLRDVPRTASVTASTGCELLTLGRDAFLAAVTGQARSAQEADLVVGARLAALRPGVVRS